MKHLENEINNLEVLRSRGELSYMGGEKLIEFNDIKRQLENQFNWISVEDELPKEHNQQVLIVTQPPNPHKQHFICTYDGVTWWCDDIDREMLHITHWMPLPKLPKN